MDTDGVRVLRSVLMKPEHEPHVPWLHERVSVNRETVKREAAGVDRAGGVAADQLARARRPSRR